MEKLNQNSKQLLEDISKIVNELNLAGDTKSNFERSKPEAERRAAEGNQRRVGEERRKQILSPEERKKIIERRMAQRRANAGSGRRETDNKDEKILARLGSKGQSSGKSHATTSVDKTFRTVEETINAINEIVNPPKKSYSKLKKEIDKRGREDVEEQGDISKNTKLMDRIRAIRNAK